MDFSKFAGIYYLDILQSSLDFGVLSIFFFFFIVSTGGGGSFISSQRKVKLSVGGEVTA